MLLAFKHLPETSERFSVSIFPSDINNMYRGSWKNVHYIMEYRVIVKSNTGSEFLADMFAMLTIGVATTFWIDSTDIRA